MSLKYFIAKRYLTYTRKSGFLSFITSFSIIGITLGSAALIIALSILGGFEKEIKEKVFSFITHIQIETFQNHPIKNYQTTIDLIQKEVKGIKNISPYIIREAMIKADEHVDGVLLKGINVNLDANLIKKYLKFGNYLSEIRQEAEIVIGKKLASKLNVNIGDEVVVFGLPLGKEHPKFSKLKIVGIFESGMAEYDDIYALTHINQTQKLFGFGNDVSGFEVLVDSTENTKTIAKSLQEVLGYPFLIKTAFQLYHNLFSWVELQKKPAPIFLGLIIIVAVVNIIGTLLMMVLEKMHDIGILRSLGVSARDIKSVFIIQGMFIAIIGVLLGNFIAFFLCEAQSKLQFFSLPSDIYFMNTVPILLKLENFLIVDIVIILLCFITSLIPSTAATKIDPIETLRFG